MIKKTQESNNTFGVVVSMVVGGLAGAGAMLLLAPQSGEKTRMQIKEKGVELRDHTTGMMEVVMARIWLTKQKISRDGRRKTKELLHQSQALFADRLEYVTDHPIKINR
jgi:gas vesicle protein